MTKLTRMTAATTDWCRANAVPHLVVCDEAGLQAVRLAGRVGYEPLFRRLSELAARENIYVECRPIRGGVLFAFSLAALSEDVMSLLTDTDFRDELDAILRVESQYRSPVAAHTRRQSAFPAAVQQDNTRSFGGVTAATGPPAPTRPARAFPRQPRMPRPERLTEALEGMAAEVQPAQVIGNLVSAMDTLGLRDQLKAAGITSHVPADKHRIYFKLNDRPIYVVDVVDKLKDKTGVQNVLKDLADLAAGKAPGERELEDEERRREDQAFTQAAERYSPRPEAERLPGGVAGGINPGSIQGTGPGGAVRGVAQGGMAEAINQAAVLMVECGLPPTVGFIHAHLWPGTPPLTPLRVALHEATAPATTKALGQIDTARQALQQAIAGATDKASTANDIVGKLVDYANQLQSQEDLGAGQNARTWKINPAYRPDFGTADDQPTATWDRAAAAGQVPAADELRDIERTGEPDQMQGFEIPDTPYTDKIDQEWAGITHPAPPAEAEPTPQAAPDDEFDWSQLGGGGEPTDFDWNDLGSRTDGAAADDDGVHIPDDPGPADQDEHNALDDDNFPEIKDSGQPEPSSFNPSDYELPIGDSGSNFEVPSDSGKFELTRHYQDQDSFDVPPYDPYAQDSTARSPTAQTAGQAGGEPPTPSQDSGDDYLFDNRHEEPVHPEFEALEQRYIEMINQARQEANHASRGRQLDTARDWFQRELQRRNLDQFGHVRPKNEATLADVAAIRVLAEDLGPDVAVKVLAELDLRGMLGRAGRWLKDKFTGGVEGTIRRLVGAIYQLPPDQRQPVFKQVLKSLMKASGGKFGFNTTSGRQKKIAGYVRQALAQGVATLTFNSAHKDGPAEQNMQRAFEGDSGAPNAPWLVKMYQDTHLNNPRNQTIIKAFQDELAQQNAGVDNISVKPPGRITLKLRRYGNAQPAPPVSPTGRQPRPVNSPPAADYPTDA